MITYDRRGALGPAEPQQGRSTVPPRVRPFRATDYVEIHAAVAQAAGHALVSDPGDVGQTYARLGPAHTAVSSTTWTPLAAAGLALQWPGRAVAWLILTPDARADLRCMAWLRRQIRAVLPVLIEAHGLRRIEADVARFDGAAIGWAAGFGFTVEGLSERFGPQGDDFFRLVILPGVPRG